MTQPWHRYVEERFDGDLRRWHSDGYRSDVSDAEPVAPYLAALPAGAAGALARWDRLARAGGIPDMFLFEEGGTYGGTGGPAGLWTLGHDGGGNRYCVLPTGEIGVWDHQTGEVESHHRFPSLDAFAWAVVRVGAIDAGTLDRDSSEAAELMGTSHDGTHYLVQRLAESLDDQ